MDLVVQTGAGVWYMDVVCLHPFTGKGKKRTASGGGTTEAQEERKQHRYQVVDPVTRRRNTLASLVPVAITSFGLLGPAATSAFATLESEARARRTENHWPIGWLRKLVTAASVFGTARSVIRAFAPPDGQGRAHLQGRAAT